MKSAGPRRGLTAHAREIFDVHTYEDRDWAARIGMALEGPVVATEIPLRVTSYLSTDFDDARVSSCVITGEASRLQPGDVTLRVLVSDLDGKRIAGGELPLAHRSEDTLPFSTNIGVPARQLHRSRRRDGQRRPNRLGRSQGGGARRQVRVDVGPRAGIRESADRRGLGSVSRRRLGQSERTARARTRSGIERGQARRHKRRVRNRLN